MELEFVNHASVIYKHGSVRLIADPWIEGTVFQNSWAHLAGSRFTYDDFKDITHIWFSHEHPDHFFPPNVRKIPVAHRERITVLFKKTVDKKVVEFCRDLGFKDVIELSPNEWHELSDGVRLLCQPYHDDSALVFDTGQQVVVNTNDCVVASHADLAPIRSQINGKIDVLLTQFSYASYVGETYDERRKHAQRKFDQMALQIDCLEPDYLIPFASYVYFCHEDNFYMNDAINKIDDVYDHFLRTADVTPIVLYPGDRWTVGATHDSERAVSRYLQDYGDASEPLVRSTSVDAPTLVESAREYHRRVRERIAYLSAVKVSRMVRPLRVFVTDHERAYELSLTDFSELSGVSRDGCGITMSSETLNFCLKFDWGFNTTSVNGKFHILDQRALRTFTTLTSLSDAMNHGRVGWSDLVKRTQRRISRRLQLARGAA